MSDCRLVDTLGQAIFKYLNVRAGKASGQLSCQIVVIYSEFFEGRDVAEDVVYSSCETIAGEVQDLHHRGETDEAPSICVMPDSGFKVR